MKAHLIMGEAVTETTYDVIVVGSGAGGLTAALAASERGLSVAVFEKSTYYGGTSALSGGQVWVPNNHLMSGSDSPALALEYLTRITGNRVSADKLRTYVETAPEMLRFLTACGVEFEASDWYPDYFSEDKAAIGGRAVVAANVDGRLLGEEFEKLRQPPSLWTLFDRYVMDTPELGLFGSRAQGWKRAFAKTMWRYWSDIGWRLKHKRDRRLTLGNALVAALRFRLIERQVPLFLSATLTSLIDQSEGGLAAVFEHRGEKKAIKARRAIILASGGFEHNKELRAEHHSVPTDISSTLAPEENTGDGIVAAQAVGADVESMDCSWWTPVMKLPSNGAIRPLRAHAVFRMPGSICVNRLGDRFTNEAESYDRFGMAMIEDHKATGANIPCWIIFDGTFRRKHPCGGVLPSIVMPDRKLPKDWWGKFIHRADTLDDLAKMIKVDGEKLRGVIETVNLAARTGVDPQFGRGSSPYDRILSGDPRVKPNPCLAAIDAAPFYAVPVDLGDLGTKGGVRVDAHARALDGDGNVMPGLYVIGNSAGAAFGDAYPGPGATLGSAMVFAYAAVRHIAAG